MNDTDENLSSWLCTYHSEKIIHRLLALCKDTDFISDIKRKTQKHLLLLSKYLIFMIEFRLRYIDACDLFLKIFRVGMLIITIFDYLCIQIIKLQ